MSLAASVGEIFLSVQKSQPAQSGISLWAIVVAASVIITVLGGVIGFLSYMSQYGHRKVQKRIDQIVVTQLDAEDAQRNKEQAEEELRRLRAAQAELEAQIHQVPQEVDRLVLEIQLKGLAESISKEFSEFKSVEEKLKSTPSTTALDPQIREAIEVGVLPMRRQQERRNTYVLLILVVLLAVNLSPLSVSFYIMRYFSILANSADWTPDAPAWMMIFGIVVISLALFCLHSLSPAIQRYTALLERAAVMVAIGFLLVVAIILGYYFRETVVAWGECYAGSCGFPAFPAFDYNCAPIAFNAASLLGGLLVFLIVIRRPKILRFFSRRHDGSKLPVPH